MDDFGYFRLSPIPEIVVREGLTGPLFVSTLFHEILHAWAWITSQTSKVEEEIWVDVAANGIACALIQNEWVRDAVNQNLRG